MERIPLIKPDLPPLEAVQPAFQEILGNGRVTNFGKYVTQFEEAAADYLGASTATVSSGTAGLILALQAFGVKPGHRVVVPSFSFMATAQAVLYAGARPLFADIDQDFTLSVLDLEFLLSKHQDISCVVPVHTFGHPCQGEKIQRVVEAHARRRPDGLRLIYDAAHAFGAERNGRRVGTFGDAEVFSLSVTKALVCVEGGLVASRDESMIERIKKMRNYGIEEGYDAHWPGLNGKMSEFHAIIGLNNLRTLEGVLSVRAAKAASYARRIEERTCLSALRVPPGVRHTFKDFHVVVPPELKPKRDAIVEFLNREGIETRAYFSPPIHEQKFFRRFSDRPLPVTEDLSRRVITLPFFTAISEEEMERVAEALHKAQEVSA